MGRLEPRLTSSRRLRWGLARSIRAVRGGRPRSPWRGRGRGPGAGGDPGGTRSAPTPTGLEAPVPRRGSTRPCGRGADGAFGLTRGACANIRLEVAALAWRTGRVGRFEARAWPGRRRSGAPIPPPREPGGDLASRSDRRSPATRRAGQRWKGPHRLTSSEARPSRTRGRRRHRTRVRAPRAPLGAVRGSAGRQVQGASTPCDQAAGRAASRPSKSSASWGGGSRPVERAVVPPRDAWSRSAKPPTHRASRESRNR
jgi:hypothetical protein